MRVFPAGVTDEKTMDVTPQHHAVAALIAPERAGVAKAHLDDRAAAPGVECPGELCRQGWREDNAVCHNRWRRDDDAPRLVEAFGRHQGHATFIVPDLVHRYRKPDAVAKVSSQVLGQRVHRLGKEILQFRDLIGDTAVVVDQIPDRDGIDRLTPQSFDRRTKCGFGVSIVRLPLQPIPYAEVTYSRIGRIDRIHAIAYGDIGIPECPAVFLRHFRLQRKRAVDRGRHQRLAVTFRQRHHVWHVLAQELAAAVVTLAKRIGLRLDPAADPAARLEDQNVQSIVAQGKCCRKAGKTCADNNDVVDHQYPALIFSNSAIIFCLSSVGIGDWKSVLSTNLSTSS
jgi:hypothetical protein